MGSVAKKGDLHGRQHTGTKNMVSPEKVGITGHFG
jgi:hypothetical protein